MRTATTKFTALLIASLIAPTAALAQKFHAGPTISLDGDTLSAFAVISGLGNGDLVATLTADATTITQCTNKGKVVVEAQEDTTTLTETEPVPVGKNGKATVNVSLSADDIGNPCPNPNWTPTTLSVTFADVAFSIVQGGVTLFECGPDALNACDVQ